MKCSTCSIELKWVVAVDIDGCLAQYHRNYVEFVEQYDALPTGSLPRRWDGIGEFRDLLGLSKKEHHERKLAFRAGGHKRWMDNFPYARTMMRDLWTMGGVEVWVTTTRPWMRMDNVDTDTVEWLRRNEIAYDYLLFDEDKYGKLTSMIDPNRIIAVLDDESEQRDRCADLNLPFVLRHTEWNYGVGHPVVVKDLFQFPPLVQERMAIRHALQH